MPQIFAIAGAAALGICQWLIYSYAPMEASMGMIQKIFYIHLPLAWWALASFFLVFIGSIMFLRRRSPQIDNLCVAAAEIGVLFSGLALATGMIWAKKSWGIWWTWDPRLSATLVMWFIYSAYLVFRSLDMPAGRKRLVCAVIGIAAFLDVPLVFFSARIFRSIHPVVFASKEGGLEPEMKLAAICGVIALGLLWFGIMLFRKRQLDLKSRLDSLTFLSGV